MIKNYLKYVIAGLIPIISVILLLILENLDKNIQILLWILSFLISFLYIKHTDNVEIQEIIFEIKSIFSYIRNAHSSVIKYPAAHERISVITNRLANKNKSLLISLQLLNSRINYYCGNNGDILYNKLDDIIIFSEENEKDFCGQFDLISEIEKVIYDMMDVIENNIDNEDIINLIKLKDFNSRYFDSEKLKKAFDNFM